MISPVAITGSSGFVGTALAQTLRRHGAEVIPVVRRPPGPGEVRWDPEAGTFDASPLAGARAVVHLAGEGLASGRWTPERKRRIRASRVDGTALLARGLAGLPSPPAVLVSASAIGFYGDRGDAVLTEADGPGRGFLSEVTVAWEAATRPASEAGLRVPILRFGLVLSPRGGALARMLTPFRLGLGGPLGSGGQWMSWVTLDDVLAALLAALERPELDGPLNVVSPTPVTNADFTRALGRALKRPARLPVPAIALELLFGELARETLLASTRVAPVRLLAAGFAFRDVELGSALRRLVG